MNTQSPTPHPHQQGTEDQSTKLRQQISKFKGQPEGSEHVSGSTITALEHLLTSLLETAGTVSAVVSQDRCLSITAVLTGERRLYVEIQKNGSLQAAISRSKTHAQDLQAATIQELIQQLPAITMREAK